MFMKIQMRPQTQQLLVSSKTHFICYTVNSEKQNELLNLLIELWKGSTKFIKEISENDRISGYLLNTLNDSVLYKEALYLIDYLLGLSHTKIEEEFIKGGIYSELSKIKDSKDAAVHISILRIMYNLIVEHKDEVSYFWDDRLLFYAVESLMYNNTKVRLGSLELLKIYMTNHWAFDILIKEIGILDALVDLLKRSDESIENLHLAVEMIYNWLVVTENEEKIDNLWSRALQSIQGVDI